MPAAEGAEDLAMQIEQHEHWPICSVHLWFDREITELDHAVLARPRDSLDVQPVAPADRAAAGTTSNWWSARRAPLRHCRGRKPSGRRSTSLAEFFPSRQRGEAGEGCAGQGGARHLRRSAGHRCRAAGRRVSVAQLLSRRRLDRDRLALDDGERRAVGASCRRGALHEHWRAARFPGSGPEAARADAVW